MDVVRHFPNQGTELARSRALTNQVELDTSRVAQRKFQQTVYPEDHPFHTFPQRTASKASSREDVVFLSGTLPSGVDGADYSGRLELRQCDRCLKPNCVNWQASGNSQM